MIREVLYTYTAIQKEMEKWLSQMNVFIHPMLKQFRDFARIILKLLHPLHSP
jgi:hypothetical protein